ncbi:BCL2/adenovirus E1B 19 kDa protein-interacting protein 2-like isoform X2 [Echeneis naucrates]|nr:BCL2/adenovirus E1B 19 kDa protein-interacting protein 2-like isoform X2 [Echeneis naucrates]XP_029369962.1 BCL2/adenovirus E1B 19 kDa protein-interacting protein 2-like isoform X2 [Echeneis naucrates]
MTANTDNTASTADTANTAKTASTANTADTANTAKTADTADTANTAKTASTANITDTANTAKTADTASTADTANTAKTASTANTADTANTAKTADIASTFNTANIADTANNAKTADTANTSNTVITDNRANTANIANIANNDTTTTTAMANDASATNTKPAAPSDDESEGTGELGKGNSAAITDRGKLEGETSEEGADEVDSNLNGDRPDPPTNLDLSQPTKKKVLAAPTLSLSLGRSESAVSDDFPSAFLSPSPDDDDEDTGLDFDLDAMETPSDSESLLFPIYDLDLEDDLRRLGVASIRCRPAGPRSKSDCQTGLGSLGQEDMVDGQGTRWRCFSTVEPPQETQVNMSVLEPFLRVLSHGGYYGDSLNDIIVFSSCYLPENSLDNYQYVMDNLFRYVVGTLDLMVSENYVIIYFCAGGQKEKLPGISWLRECYTTIHRRLRKNLKGFYVVHPTWYIKALITIIKPFISTKFSRKLQFINSLQDLSQSVPTEHVQIPDCVRQYDQNLSS